MNERADLPADSDGGRASGSDDKHQMLSKIDATRPEKQEPMPTSTGDEGWNRYAVLQRCQFLGDWPREKHFQTSWIKKEVKVGDKVAPAFFRYVIGFRTYETPFGKKVHCDLKYTYLHNNDVLKVGDTYVC